MVNEALTTADSARMPRQIMDNEEKEAVEAQDPRFAFYDCYRVPWRGTEILYCLGLERGVVNSPVCGVGDWKNALDISLAEDGTRVDIPAQARHLMEVHGLTEYVVWQVWNHPGDLDKMRGFLDIPN